MSTARQVVAQAVRDTPLHGDDPWGRAADRVLAALREHWTEPEERQRVATAVWGPFGDGQRAVDFDRVAQVFIAVLFEERP